MSLFSLETRMLRESFPDAAREQSSSVCGKCERKIRFVDFSQANRVVWKAGKDFPRRENLVQGHVVHSKCIQHGTWKQSKGDVLTTKSEKSFFILLLIRAGVLKNRVKLKLIYFLCALAIHFPSCFINYELSSISDVLKN